MKKCSGCDGLRDRPGQYYCLSCSAKYKRRRRVNSATVRFKEHARDKIRNAIRDGRLTRQPCEVCGALAEAHHPDYSKPFDVMWLCKTHHWAEHRRMKEIENVEPLQATG